MKKICFLTGTIVMFLLDLNQTKAQALYAQQLSGSPLREKKYTDVNGNPYLVDRWEKATVLLANGQTYNGIDVKYDLVSDDLTFRNSKGDSLNFVQPVKEFKLSYIDDDKPIIRLYRNGFQSTGAKSGEKTFYEVLYDGSTKLLKRHFKTIWMETTTYGTATQTKNISDNIAYFVNKADKMIPVKADKKSVLAALNDKSAQLDNYIKDNKLDLKQDNDLAKVFEYYNSL